MAGKLSFSYRVFEGADAGSVKDWSSKRAAAAILSVKRRVERIVEEVRIEGDDALCRHAREFDGWEPRPEDLRVEVPSREEAESLLGPEIIATLEACRDSIRRYHENDVPRSWFVRSATGSTWGRIYRPLESVGVYVPGGRHPYISTVMMTVVPAKVAGTRRVQICTPGDLLDDPVRGPIRKINPAILAAASLAGADELYLLGGASAIAAMAFGTPTVKKVDKVVGPGNAYVTAAKKLVFGEAGVDMLAGPSELAILADDTADPALVAADMLSQLEHDPLSWAATFTRSPKLAGAIVQKLDAAGGIRDSRGGTSQAGCVVAITPSDEQALRIINCIAPEHLQIVHELGESLLPEIKTAGAVYIGPFTPTAIGDYAAGPSHVLPTSGCGRYSSALGASAFMRSSTVCSLSREEFERLRPAARALAKLEGMELHAAALDARGSRAD